LTKLGRRKHLIRFRLPVPKILKNKINVPASMSVDLSHNFRRIKVINKAKLQKKNLSEI